MSTLIWILGIGAALVVATKAAWIDAKTRRLPNNLVGATAALSWSTLIAVNLVDPSPHPIRDAVIAVAIIALPFVVVWLIAPTAIGAGDVKLVLGLAPALAWPTSQYAFLALVAMFVLPLGTYRTWRNGSLAFGPYIVAGVALVAVINIVVGAP